MLAGMNGLGPFALVVLPIGLGLLGFVEPCSIGATLLFVKYMEGRDRAARIAQVLAFTLARAFFTGALGLAALALGAAFAGWQKAGWLLLGGAYVAIGLLLAAGRGRTLMLAIGPRLDRLSPARGAAGLGVLFGLNLPACAAPLLVALLGAAAVAGSGAMPYLAGFAMLALFGLALSAPLVAAVFNSRARRALDRLAALSGRFPLWAGVVLIALGLWSIRFAFVAELGL